MFSRLKSAVKGVVGTVRGHSEPPPAARPAPTPVRTAPVPPPVRVAAPAVPAAPAASAPVLVAAAPDRPIQVATPVEPAPAVAKNGPAVNGTTNGSAVKTASPAPTPDPAPPAAVAAPAPEVAPVAPPKKLSLVAQAAAAAKSAPSKVVAADDDEHDDHAPARKLTDLAKAGGAAKKTHLHADMGSTDVEAYRLRAIANNRDPATITGQEGRNVATDGHEFWGPLDNESAQAKADGRILTVDQFECISCGTCVEQTNRVFYLPNDGKATPIAQDGPMDLIQDAIEACPVTCIHWMTTEEVEGEGIATGIGQDFSDILSQLHDG